MRRWLSCALIGLLMYSGGAAAADYACAANPDIVASCFAVRGRLSFWNGAPSARLWPVGTTRLLGIHNDVLPPNFTSMARDFDTEIWGAFEVCPFTPRKSGSMQFVCIESWRDISIRQRTGHADKPA
jgi:hypothetical protein